MLTKDQQCGARKASLNAQLTAKRTYETTGMARFRVAKGSQRATKGDTLDTPAAKRDARRVTPRPEGQAYTFQFWWRSVSSMARPIRLEFAGACYHVTARGDRQEPIFGDDGDRLVFLDLLAKEVLQQGWRLYAFCLMGNHYHLLLETPEPNLVQGMRRLNGVYTQAFNRRHNKSGHVLQGRYKSILVDKQGYLQELCRYVVLNPVRAGMVDSVEDWHWSSYRPTAGKLPRPPWLAAEAVLEWFGEGAPAQKAYERFVAQGVKQPSPWDSLKGQIYLGSEPFHAEIQKRLAGQRPKGVSQRQLHPVRPSVEAILQSVAGAHGIKSALVLKRQSGSAFKQAVYLLRRRANLSLAEVAAMAGVSIGRVAQIQSEIESLPADKGLMRIASEL